MDLDSHKMYLTAYYSYNPSELESELLDDIETNSQAHIPDFLIYTEVKLGNDYGENKKHDFVVFAIYEES
ncbi:hypothetical protein SNE25_23435 [Mucilaginibacter sabulilitoris]|uniref:Uncharacterized protein n=1 Tax=Mucilaginibacter sabulilitoris TaxID=1173583 RepID=A0ABZ0TGG2_9SPHI|nr:hypothetical protein [Mucilaginibacter sabulilitoris]WPU92280.1 hypothetical protein SNE25_23435 [Mucilaginibacter sabulilitoris]